MPSPVGHVLAGVTAGWVTAGPCRQLPSRTIWTRVIAWLPPRLRPLAPAAAFAALPLLPDVDFLFGAHSAQTHSLGAMAVVFVAALAVVGPRRPGLALAAALAYGSHILLDWMGSDSTPPLGIMALWPLSNEFYQSDLYLFPAISRRYWLAGFWLHNFGAVATEVALLGPPALAAWWFRGRRRLPLAADGAAGLAAASGAAHGSDK
jgi:membrane-bound metal-dependent hydrolase YbcI (DUF457 family)